MLNIRYDRENFYRKLFISLLRGYISLKTYFFNLQIFVNLFWNFNIFLGDYFLSRNVLNKRKGRSQMVTSFVNRNCDIYIINNWILFLNSILFKWLCILLLNYFKLKMMFQGYLKQSIWRSILLLIIAKNVRPNSHSIEEHVFWCK